MVSWAVVFAKQAMKDAKKIAASGLKAKAQDLLDVLAKGGVDPAADPNDVRKWTELRSPDILDVAVRAQTAEAEQRRLARDGDGCGVRPGHRDGGAVPDRA